MGGASDYLGHCPLTNDDNSASKVYYRALGAVEILAILVFLYFVRRVRVAAKRGSRTAARALVLPVYDFLVYYIIVVAAIVALISLISINAGTVWIAVVKWTLYRCCTEGFAYFLMQHGVGRTTVLRAVGVGFVWAVSSAAIWLLVAVFGSYDAAVATLFGFIILLWMFYLVLWVTPLKMVPRRPSILQFSRFQFVIFTVILTVFLTRFIPHDDLPWRPCVRTVCLSLLDVVQPFVVLRALQQDSQYWQGLYQEPSHNVNQPLLGMWEVGAETVQTLAQQINHLESHVVPIIHFGNLNLRTTRFFAGGTARVYRGKYRDETVAVKILFCIELTPESVMEFCHEASVLHSLSHPNVVRCHGVCVMPPALCLVTEFCKHGSLYDFLHQYQQIFAKEEKRSARRRRRRAARAGGLRERDSSTILEEGTVLDTGSTGTGGRTVSQRIFGPLFQSVRRMRDAHNATSGAGVRHGGNSNSNKDNTGLGADALVVSTNFSAPLLTEGNGKPMDNSSVDPRASNGRGSGTSEDDRNDDENDDEDAYGADDYVGDRIDGEETSIVAIQKCCAHLCPWWCCNPEVLADEADAMETRHSILSRASHADVGRMSVMSSHHNTRSVSRDEARSGGVRTSMMRTGFRRGEGARAVLTGDQWMLPQEDPLEPHDQGHLRYSDSFAVRGTQSQYDANMFGIMSTRRSEISHGDMSRYYHHAQEEPLPRPIDGVDDTQSSAAAMQNQGAHRTSEHAQNPRKRGREANVRGGGKRPSTDGARVLSAPAGPAHGDGKPQSAFLAPPPSVEVSPASSTLSRSDDVDDRDRGTDTSKGTEMVASGSTVAVSSVVAPNGGQAGMPSDVHAAEEQANLLAAATSASAAHRQSKATEGDGVRGESGADRQPGPVTAGHVDEEEAQLACAAGASVQSSRSSAGGLDGESGSMAADAGMARNMDMDGEMDTPVLHTQEPQQQPAGGSPLSAEPALSGGVSLGAAESKGAGESSRLTNDPKGVGSSHLSSASDSSAESSRYASSHIPSGGVRMSGDGRGRSIFMRSALETVTVASKTQSGVYKLPTDLRVRFIRDCIRGVAFVHDKQLVHCDIKSLNFLVANDLTIKLADLGEVRKAATIATTDELFPQSGTYTPPEILRNQREKFSNKLDIWSLGLVICEIISEYMPFEGPGQQVASQSDLLRKIMDGVRPELPTETPEWLCAMVGRALSLEPEDRISAEEMLQIVEAHTSHMS